MGGTWYTGTVLILKGKELKEIRELVQILFLVKNILKLEDRDT